MHGVASASRVSADVAGAGRRSSRSTSPVDGGRAPAAGRPPWRPAAVRGVVAAGARRRRLGGRRGVVGGRRVGVVAAGAAGEAATTASPGRRGAGARRSMRQIVGAAQPLRPRAATGHGTQRRRRSSAHSVVGEVDGGADVVRHDVDLAAQRRQRRAREVDDRVVLGELHDPGVRVVEEPAEARWRTPPGRRRAPCCPRRATSRPPAWLTTVARQVSAIVVGRDRAELPLLGVAEDVDAGPQLGQRRRCRRGPGWGSSRR